MKLNIDDIEITEKIQDFKQYLETTDRIILSARFGDGKTYFLDKIRNDEELKNQYEFFTIYPVNYSVATNEDIFEYIKRDILSKLQELDVFDEMKIDLDALFGVTCNFQNLSEVISYWLSIIPGAEKYQKLYDHIYNWYHKTRSKYDEKKHTADKYLSSFNFKGSIYENDGYTKLIREGLKWIRGEKDCRGRKESVLIIEDLDRLDPGHLFRILNVLSAHIDDTTRPDLVKNKFGFHNIVIVMDYEATKHIFHHFYGEGANFEGYISKFLSREPIRYSIKAEMRRKIKEELSDQLGIQKLFDNFVNFNTKLDSFSLRDLKKLSDFDTTDKTIKGANIDIHGSKLSSELPIFHLISYMVEAGMNANEIVRDLVFESMQQFNDQLLIEHLRLMYPMYLFNYGGYFDFCTYRNKFFKVELLNNDDGCIIAIKIESMKKRSEESKDLSNLNENTIKWSIEAKFSEIINLSALSLQ